MPRSPPLFCFLGVGAAVLFSTQAARASTELSTAVTTLRRARAAYGRVVQLKPRLLERGDRLPVAIPPELLNPKDSSCTTVALLGVRELHFVVRFSEFDPGAPSSAFSESSAAGALEVVRCGASKPFLGDLLVELRSPRGVLETVISNAPAGVPALIEALPERDPGTELPLGDPGPVPAPAPLAQRVARLEARAKRDGALLFERGQWSAHEDGSGGATLPLKAGCHELTLLEETPPPPGAPPVDLDLELLGDEGGPPLAIDRAEESDAAGSICLGSASNIELRFVGAAPGARLLMTHAFWDLPTGIPSRWGPEARAKLSRLAKVQRFPARSAPIYESLGVQGTTELPIEVEPDACYTVLLAPLRGEVQSLSLSVSARAPGEGPRGASDPAGTAVSFCAQGAQVAQIEIDGRGTSLAWLLAAWQTGRTPLGLGTP